MTDKDLSRLTTLCTLPDSEETSARDTKWVINLLNQYRDIASTASILINAMVCYENYPNSKNDRAVTAAEDAYITKKRSGGKMTDELPRDSKVLYQFTTSEDENVTGHDDMAAEYIVFEEPKADGGLIVYGRRRRDGEWVANWPSRHVIRRLLKIMEAM